MKTQTLSRPALQCLGYALLAILMGCTPHVPIEPARPQLAVSQNRRYLAYENGTPFFWLGGTTWGMSEWLNREEVDYYLDDRKAKGFSLVQICLFWGKREDDPLKFTLNPANAYGFKAFKEVDGEPDTSQPLVLKGGSPENPNDYWDHVDYILQAAAARDMFVGLLPVWGRRYVNTSQNAFAAQVFSSLDMYTYGKFLGERFQSYTHIIWLLGGDVKANEGGDFLGHYRRMAEGIITGITQDTASWNEASPLWDFALMSYHPDGAPMKNSSEWFHRDAWLDFNMIETFKHQDAIPKAVQQDYDLYDPIKPTVMGEPAYESAAEPYGNFTGLDLRRQAFQSIFAGAAGFTYGAFRDENGNGPLFSPYQGWQELLDLEGANTMQFVKSFALKNKWPAWTPVTDLIMSGQGVGALQKLAVISESSKECFIYFPDLSVAMLDLNKYFEQHETVTAYWYNPVTGTYSGKEEIKLQKEGMSFKPPSTGTDAILILANK